MSDVEIAQAVERVTLEQAMAPAAYSAPCVPLTRESIEIGRTAVVRLRAG